MAKKPGNKILRLGLIQNQKILEERLMRSPETVTIGHDYKKNTLVVPASNLPRSFSVFKWKKDAYLLQFTEEMEGRVSRGGKVQTLSELRQKEIAKKKGDVYQLKLTPSMRGRVTLGEATVLFQFVTPPPKRARPVLPSSMKGGLVNGVDRSLAILVLLSALIQVGFVVYLEMQDWPVPEDRDVRIQDRMAQIIGEEEPDIDELEDEEDDDGEDEQEEEDAADDPDPEPEPEPEPAEEMTPEELAEERHDERMEVTERVEDTTVLGTLTADGDEETAFERMTERVGDVDAQDAFGDATRVETGAGLEADRLGEGGGSPDATGEGDFAEGEEMDEIGGDADVDTGDRQEQEVETVEVDMQEEAPDTDGQLDTQRLQQALGRIRNNIESCYQNHLRQNPQARGTVRVMITITDRGNRGEISNAEVVADEVDSANSVGQCIARELERGRVGRLPPPEGGDAMITIPYHFSPG